MALSLELKMYPDGLHPVFIPIVLRDQQTLEFPGYDIETELAARELGFEVSGPELRLYATFVERGLAGLLARYPEEFFEAFEEQGYAAIKTPQGEPFTDKEFVALLVANLVRNLGYIEDQLETLSAFVDLGDTDAGLMTQEEFADVLVRLLKEQVRIDDSNVDPVAQWLSEVITADDVDYTVQQDHYYESDVGENVERSFHSLSILGEDLLEWTRLIESRIYDPISFAASVTDWCEHDSSFCTPPAAEDVLAAFDLTAEEPDDPDDPEHPTSDENGEFAVLYEHYETRWVQGQGSVRTDEIEETYVVPYSDESDAREAMDLSETILSNAGEEEEWGMTLLRAKTAAELAEQAVERRIWESQLRLFDGEEPPWADDPEWMEEWVAYQDDEE